MKVIAGAAAAAPKPPLPSKAVGGAAEPGFEHPPQIPADFSASGI